MSEKSLSKAALWIVLIHLVFNLIHGWAHEDKTVPVTFIMYLFIIPVIMIGPFVSLGLIWKRFLRSGYALLALTMAGSFFFGLAFHFLIDGPDHVGHVQGGLGASLFFWTSIGLAVSEAGGALLGTWGVLQAMSGQTGRTANAPA
jgi:hypothetical protein